MLHTKPTVLQDLAKKDSDLYLHLGSRVAKQLQILKLIRRIPEHHHEIRGRNPTPLRVLRYFLFYLTVVAAIAWANPAKAEDLETENVETLNAIQVPGTVVIREKRILSFPAPEIPGHATAPIEALLRIPVEFSINHHFDILAVSIDETGKTRGIRSSVKPVKAERPPYPRFAREQGWEGTVVLRLVIEPDGKVSSAKPRKSSGYPILDESAVQSVQDWTFLPAKNGEFPVTATVDLPVRYDLDQ